MGLSYQLRKALARFRCSSHTLNIEVGRLLGIDRDDRISSFCLDIYQINCIEDEFHVFFQCPQFSELQIKYLYNWFNGNPTRHDLYHLLSSTNDFVIRKVAIFIHKVLQLETSEISCYIKPSVFPELIPKYFESIFVIDAIYLVVVRSILFFINPIYLLLKFCHKFD